MLKLRWILLLLAIGTATVVVDFTRQTAQAGPRTMLLAGRNALGGEDPDYDGALLHLERGITLARAANDREALLDLLRTQCAVYMGRYDRAAKTPGLFPEASDLDQVIDDCQSCVLEFGSADREILEMGARASLAAGRPALAVSFLQQLLEIVPGTAELQLLLGRAHLALVHDSLAELEDRLLRADSEATREQLHASLRRALTLPFSDARRTSEIEKLSRDLPPIHRAPVLKTIERGSRSLARATTAFLRVLEAEPNGQAVVGLEEILILAGARNRAVDLARTALDSPAITDRQFLVRQTVTYFLEIGREGEASRIAVQFLEDEDSPFDVSLLPRSDLIAWCPLLLRLERWKPLKDVAATILQQDWLNRIADEDSGRARFYSGVAMSHGGSPSAARVRLLQSDPRGKEFYPGMRLEWAEALARCDKELRDDRAAHQDLLAATRAVPPGTLSPRLARIAGNAWRAFAELLERDKDFYRAEDAISRALEQLPSEREELERIWKRIGRESLKKRGRLESEIREIPVDRGSAGQYPQMGSFEVCMRAEAAIAAGTVGPVPVLLQPTLETYPRLPAALELLAQTEVLRGRFDRAIEAELSLFAAARGSTSGLPRANAGLELLRSIPESAYSGEQRRRWILLDPTAAGWTAVIDELHNRGDHAGLRRALQQSDLRKLASSQLLHAARTAVADGALPEALSCLQAIPAGTDEAVAGAGLQLMATARLGERTHSNSLLSRLARKLLSKITGPQLADSPGFLKGAALAIANGGGTALLPLLDHADSKGTRSRGALLLLRSLAESAAGDPARAQEDLDRAEPWLEERDAWLARLLLAADAGDNPDWARYAASLTTEFSDWSPLESTLLALLSGDPDRIPALADLPKLPAPDILNAALRESIANPVGSQSTIEELPAALALALLLAAERAPFAAWTSGRLARAPESARQTPLALWARARSLETLEEHQAAERVLRSGAAQTKLPSFFTEREQLLRSAAGGLPLGARGPAQARLLAALQEHLEVLGPGGMSPEEVGLVQLRDSLRSGQRERSRAILEQSLAANPTSLVLRIEEARFRAAPGARWKAFEAYSRLLIDNPTADLGHLLPEILALLHDGLREGELSDEAFAAGLDALAARFPWDPMPTRELAEWTLGSRANPADWSVRRAFDLLERFQRHPGLRSIEALRSGESQYWFRLMAVWDPDRAESFVRSELEEHLGSATLWSTWCRALEASGRPDEALTAYDSIQDILSTPELLRGRALLRLDLGLPLPTGLLGLLTSPELGQQDPELAARCAVSLAHRGGPGGERALQVALDLWNKRHERSIPIVPFARHLAQALAPTDPGAADRVLQEALAETRYPVEVTVESALRSLLAARAAGT